MLTIQDEEEDADVDEDVDWEVFGVCNKLLDAAVALFKVEVVTEEEEVVVIVDIFEWLLGLSDMFFL